MDSTVYIGFTVKFHFLTMRAQFQMTVYFSSVMLTLEIPTLNYAFHD